MKRLVRAFLLAVIGLNAAGCAREAVVGSDRVTGVGLPLIGGVYQKEPHAPAKAEQAAQAALANPAIPPAGQEILRSSACKSRTEGASRLRRAAGLDAALGKTPAVKCP